ncbi:helix-turn-helix domain-containing protein [Streptomyces qaidamensis]|uniref:helix-turn-helix domain-containing protein n=1 Tax=Streptomyces qaidamensis TaxID=1783515 RepID=UPI001F0084D1|nr:helix-turn-helix transcriptional regulator [Streptomyces qaidamensis]
MTGDRSRGRAAPPAWSRYGRDAARSSAEDRGHAELARGRRQLSDGSVDDARETLLLAASLLAAGAPDAAEAARLCAADAAWASGDVTACLTALDATDTPGPADGHPAPDTVTVRELAHDHAAPTAVEGGSGAASGLDGDAAVSGLGGGAAVSGVDGGAVGSGLEGDAATTVGRGGGPASGLDGDAAVSGLGGGAAVSGVGGGAAGSGLEGDAATTVGRGGGPASGLDGDAAVSGLGGGAAVSGVGGGAAVSGLEGAPATTVVRGGGPASGLDGGAAVSGPGGGAAVSGVGGGAAVSGLEGAPATTVVRGGGPASGLDGGAPASGPDVGAPVGERGGGGASPPDGTNLTHPPAGGGQPKPPGVGRGRDRDPFFRDYRDGMRALLARRPEHAAGPLRRVLSHVRHDDPPERLLRAASAALLLGDVHAARVAGARALAVARTAECVASEARALEYLAYGELRAGRHAQARAHAEEGVRAALLAGHRNTAASHHAMLALAASIEGDTAAVAGYASAALATARRHGLAQAATLAEWAIARADLARGRPVDAADRLAPLVGPGPRRGHFAVWMLAVPCFVEAAVLAGQPEDARGPVGDLARWADFGADPHASAQLARCRALLATDDREADDLYLRALALHDGSGGDFERARTELLYGRWLRRRRRLREARGRLGAALVAFERCGAGAWADQTRGELRANGAASGKEPAAGLARLTPQQLRIARHVAEGATNREVAQRLAVSTRTVDYHLRNVFAALGVRSRIELARMVDQEHR